MLHGYAIGRMHYVTAHHEDNVGSSAAVVLTQINGNYIIILNILENNTYKANQIVFSPVRDPRKLTPATIWQALSQLEVHYDCSATGNWTEIISWFNSEGSGFSTTRRSLEISKPAGAVVLSRVLFLDTPILGHANP